MKIIPKNLISTSFFASISNILSVPQNRSIQILLDINWNNYFRFMFIYEKDMQKIGN